MSRFLELIVDGTHYKVGVEFGTLDRSFELMEGNGSTTSMSGYSIRDLIGTNTEYSMTIHSLPGQQSDYDALYEVLTSPVDSHMFKLDNNGVIEEFEAQIESGDDEYLGFENGVHHWDNLSVTFKPIVPQELVEYGGDSPDVPVIDPNIRTMGDLVMSTMRASNTGQTFHIANGTATMNSVFYYDIDTKYMQRGKYAFTCCPAGASSSTYYATIFTAGSTYDDYGEGVLFNYDGESNIVYAINFVSGITASNISFSPVMALRQAENDLIDYVEEVEGTYTGLTITRTIDWNGWNVSGTSSVDVDIPLSVVYNTETFPNGNYMFSTFSAGSGASSSTFYMELICDNYSFYDYGSGIVFKALRSNPDLSYILHIKAGQAIDTTIIPTLDKTYDGETIEDVYEINGLTISTSYDPSRFRLLTFTVDGTATKDTILETSYYNAYIDAGNYWFTNGGSYDPDYENSKLCYTSLVIGEPPNEAEYIISQTPIDGVNCPSSRFFTYDGISKIKYVMHFKAGYTKSNGSIFCAYVYKVDASINYITSLVTTSASSNGITVTKISDTEYSVNGTSSEQAYIPINLAFIPLARNGIDLDTRESVLISGCPHEGFDEGAYNIYPYALRGTIDNVTYAYEYGYGYNWTHLPSGSSFAIYVASLTSVNNAIFTPAANKMKLMYTGRYKEYGILFTAVLYSSGMNGVIISGTCTNPLTDPYNPSFIDLGEDINVIDVSSFTSDNVYISVSPPNASASTYYSNIYVTSQDGSDYYAYHDYGKGVVVPIKENYIYTWSVTIYEGVTIPGALFRPRVEETDSGSNLYVTITSRTTNATGLDATIEYPAARFITFNGTSDSRFLDDYYRIYSTTTRLEKDKCYIYNNTFPQSGFVGVKIDIYNDDSYTGFDMEGHGGIFNTYNNSDDYISPVINPWFPSEIAYNNFEYWPVVTLAPKLSYNGIDLWYALYDDGEKDYVANGTAILDAIFTFSYTKALNGSGTYYMNCCPPNNGSSTTFYTTLTVGSNTYYDYGDGIEFEYNGIDELIYTIVIKAGIEMSCVYFGPRIKYVEEYVESFNYIYDVDWHGISSYLSPSRFMGNRFIVRNRVSGEHYYYKVTKCQFVFTAQDYQNVSTYMLRLPLKLKEKSDGYYKLYVAAPGVDASKYRTAIKLESDSSHLDEWYTFEGRESEPIFLTAERQITIQPLHWSGLSSSPYTRDRLYHIALVKVPDPE